MKTKLLKILFLFAMILSVPHFAQAQIYFQDNFESYNGNLDTPASLWSYHSPNATTLGTSGGRSGQYGIYSVATDPINDQNNVFQANIGSLNLSQVYVSFWAKAPVIYGGAMLKGSIDATQTTFETWDITKLPQAPATIVIGTEQISCTGESGNFLTGCTRGVNGSVSTTHADWSYVLYQRASKFLKVFGKRDAPTGYANTTFGIDYTDNRMDAVSFGDGIATDNDTNTNVGYDGSHWDPLVVVNNFSSSFNPFDGQWHHYDYFVKHNTNGNRDGEFDVWIDGVLRLKATNIKNRNDLNSLYWDYIQLGAYTPAPQMKGYAIDYDDVVISSDLYPYTTSPSDVIAPAAPSGLAVQ